MNLQLLQEELAKFQGLSHVHGYFPENVEPPYVAFKATEDNPVFSDGRKVYADESVEFIFVTAEKRDYCLECQLDDMFYKHGVAIKKSMEFDADQKIHTVTYNFTVD